MTKLNELFKSIKKTFTLQKKVDFEELKISIILESLTAMEELMVLEACKDYEGGVYLEAIKKSSLAYSIKQINDMHNPDKIEEIVFNEPEVNYEDDQGKPQKESKYLFLLHQIESWPAAVRDVLFDAFNNLHVQLEVLVNSKTKFERFTVQQPAEETKEENVPGGFRKLDKEAEPIEETEVEKLNKRVAEEQAEAQLDISRKEQFEMEKRHNG
jgi:hypothetical protein